jgi:hypothetical protein
MPIDFSGLGPDDFGGSDDPVSVFETGWDRQMRGPCLHCGAPATRYARCCDACMALFETYRPQPAEPVRRCVCDRNPDTTDGPDIDCPEHGADACAAQREPQHVKRYAGPDADPRKPARPNPDSRTYWVSWVRKRTY